MPVGEPRLIAGNLDCERTYAEEIAAERGAARRPGPLRRPIAERVAALATLLRAFALPGDRLWTPARVEPARVRPIPELPEVSLIAGPLSRAPAAGEVLAWCETGETAALRGAPGARPHWGARAEDEPETWPADEGAPRAPPGSDAASAPRGAEPLWRAVWRAPRPHPRAAARANHRGFCFDLAGRLGLRLPGERRVHSARELEAHLAAGGARAGGGAWVVKAPHGAAARERAGQRDRALRADVRVRVERLLGEQGELFFEPWVRRTADFGACGLALPGGPVVFEPHRLHCDRQGVARAVEADLAGTVLPPPIRRELLDAAREAGRALAESDYLGPYNVDAFSFIGDDGAERIRPLCELNARLSFGFVARALCERVGVPRGFDRARLELRAADAIDVSEGERALPLVAPPSGAPDPAAALIVGAPKAAK